MKKLNYSNFELIESVIKDLNFNYKADGCEKLETLKTCWIETIGNKIANFTKVSHISDDNILTILCADSFVANELYISKDRILKLLKEKTEKTGINIEDIIFNYKQWKE